MSALTTHADIGQRWLTECIARATRAPESVVVMSYQGEMTHEQVQNLLAVAEEASLTNSDPMPLRKRMMNVMVEGLENVHHHSLASHGGASFALLVREDQCYRISFGNAVPLAMAALISHRIGILNEMDEADLKEHYLKLLSNTARSEHGGAGLGLLTMARKCMKPLVARTERISPEAAYLTMEVMVCFNAA